MQFEFVWFWYYYSIIGFGIWIEMDGPDGKNGSQSVRVAVNVRPLVTPELLVGCSDCISVTPGEPQVIGRTISCYFWTDVVVYDYCWISVKSSRFIPDLFFCKLGANWFAFFHIWLCVWEYRVSLLSDFWWLRCSPGWCTISWLQCHSFGLWPGIFSFTCFSSMKQLTVHNWFMIVKYVVRMLTMLLVSLHY